MASTYSTNLAIELIGTGDQAGTWGNTTNTNLGTLIEQAISGYVTQAVSTGTDTTITIPNGATGVARNMYIELTGTGGTNTNLIVPSNKKLYFIFNNASGAVTVKVSGQTGVSVPAGKKVVLASNGTDTVNALNYIADFGSNSATITQLTATSATITNLTLTSLVISNLSIASANVTVLTSASATITNLLATSLTVSSGSTLNGGVVINEPGADVDFRVEGDTDANLVFVDASTDRVGVGTSSPVSKFDITGAFGTSTTAATITNSTGFSASNIARIDFRLNNGFSGTERTAAIWSLNPNAGTNNGGALVFGVSANGTSTTPSEVARFDQAGNLGLGVTPSAWGSIFKAVQVGTGGSIFGRASANQDVCQVGANVFWDGSNWKYIASLAATRYEQASGTHVWSYAASGTAGSTISFTEAMTLDASGNLGVGTTSPGQKLVVAGNIVGDSWIGRSNISAPSADAAIYRAADNTLAFSTASTERARITSGGYSKFSNSGNYTNATGTYHEFYQTAAGSPGCYFRATSGSYTGTVIEGTGDRTTTNNTYNLIDVYNGTLSGRFVVRDSGNCLNTNGSYGALSDQKLKQDIVDAASQWDDIKSLRVRKYRFKDKPDEALQIGIIAQELEQVSPGLVEESVDRDKEGNDLGTTTKSVKYSVLYMKAVKALQEAMTRIEQLEAKVAALEAK